MICDLDNINEIIMKEGLNLLVVSYGGSASNVLTDTLEKNNYKIRTKTWNEILCHCPHYIETDVPIIYIYDNPIKSFLSMKRRGLQKINQKKMSNNNNVSFSDENFIKVMINQFNKWTNQKRKNVLIVKTNELFETSIVNKLESFLKKKIHHFPIKHVQPKTKTNIKDVEKYKKLFKKYQAELDFIDTYCADG
jgi:hypothetical protein